MQNKASILMLSSWYPSPDNKTEGSFVHEQVRMFQKRGHKVIVIKPNLNGSVLESLKGKLLKSRTYQFEGVQVYEVNINVFLPKLKRFYYTLLQKKVDYRIRKEQLDFDIMHSHSLLTAGIIAPYLSERLCKPLFHTEHTSGLIFTPKQFDNLDRKGIKLIIKIASKILFVSEYAKNHSLEYKDHLSEKVCVLHNIVEDRFFKKPFSAKKNTILVIGDFIERKNHSFLLKVWKRYQEQSAEDNIINTLVFAGNGFDSKEFKKIASGVNNIETRNRLDREEVLQIISESKLLLSSSKLETFGLTIAEALALGTPVVVTDSGGPRDIIEQGDGFIVAQGEIDLFAQKMVEVLNGEHEDPNIIRQHCQKKFSEDIIYSKLISLYQS